MTPSEPTCPFCKIVSGEMDATVVARAPLWIAFAPDHPAALGHTLVAPTRHTPDLFGLTPEESAAIGEACRVLGHAVTAAAEADGMNVITSAGAAAEQTVFHMHIHLLPRHNADGISIWPDAQPHFDRASVERVSAGIAKRLPGQPDRDRDREKE